MAWSTGSAATIAAEGLEVNGGLLLTDHWIGGAAVTEPTEERIEVLAPATTERVCDVSAAGEISIENAVRAAERSEWSALDARDRGRLLSRLAAIVDSHRVELAKIEHLDTGKSVSDAESIDLENAVRWLEYAAGWPKRVEGAVLPVDTGHFAYTLREPVGVVAAITPWNYPLMLAVWKLAPALAAGCPVVLKPSELAPLSCLMLGHLATVAGLPDGAINVIAGDGITGAALVDHPRVRKVSFTGSQVVGREVAQRCAARGATCTTELGGKSAAILMPGRVGPDLAEAARELSAGIAHNAGQACNAPARALVSERDVEEFYERLEREFDELDDVGPLISNAAYDRVDGYVARAIDRDHELIATSVPAGPEEGGWRYPATAVEVGNPGDELWREEVFGPVIAVMPIADGIDWTATANDSEHDLAAGVFGERAAAMSIARELRAGHVYINCWSVQDPCAPFGGMGGSGIGREHGAQGLDAFLTTKTVFAA